MDELKNAILSIIDGADTSITAADLSKRIKDRFDIPHRRIHRIIKVLVTGNELAYGFSNGRVVLIRSFLKPVHLAETIVVKPERTTYTPRTGEHVITLKDGVSFGSGRHPTTALALKALVFIFSRAENAAVLTDGAGIDIGTGSGILAIAALKFGLKSVTGIDMDPNAVWEARENAKANHLDNRLILFAGAIDELQTTTDVIIANLRTPTLIDIACSMRQRLNPGGFIILSGIKTGEEKFLVDRVQSHRLRCIWEKQDKGWAGLIFHHGGRLMRKCRGYGLFGQKKRVDM